MCYYQAMYFIVGLGNPGKEYQDTRHNLGFMLLDQLAEKWQLNFTAQKKCYAETTKRDGIYLVKPQTFMNDSGLSVQAMIKYFSDSSEKSAKEFPHLFVAFDDLDLEVGHFKIQYGTGPKVHNGLSSIYDHLKTNQFWHVRIGADGRLGNRTIPPTQYVLSGFSPAEKKLVQDNFTTIIEELEKKVEHTS